MLCFECPALKFLAALFTKFSAMKCYHPAIDALTESLPTISACSPCSASQSLARALQPSCTTLIAYCVCHGRSPRYRSPSRRGCALTNPAAPLALSQFLPAPLLTATVRLSVVPITTFWRFFLKLNPWIIVLVLLIVAYVVATTVNTSPRAVISYDNFLQQVDQGAVKQVIITDNLAEIKFDQQVKFTTINGDEITGSTARTLLPSIGTPDNNLISKLNDKKINYSFQNPSNWLPLLLNFLPIVLLIFFFWLIFMRSSGAQGQVMQFGQSRAKQYGKERRVNTTFADVAGHDEVKRELVEIVDFLKNPGKYHAIGAEIPKGVLLVGPPGTGKTLLARAVAGEAGVPFFSVSASEFMEMFVGVGASRVRSLFEDARKGAPGIIFIDELDSIGRKRGAGIGGGHDEREQTLNQILSEMDGFDKQTSVIVLAATNRPDILDPALLRPGRFDRQVTVGLPNVKEREAILRVHMRNKPIDSSVHVEEIAKTTPGMAGADLKNLVNEAALEGARAGRNIINFSDFGRALDKILLGLERGSLVLSPEVKRTIAYHEAGHAIVGMVLPNADKPSKVTIVPRGYSLGVTITPPDENRMILMSKEAAEDRLSMIFGGRAAEEAFIGSVTSGASNDFQQAIGLAKRMVLEWGMGERFKNIAWGGNSGPVFLGEQLMNRSEVSEDTARLIDEDIKNILERAYSRTVGVMREYASAMHDVAAALLRDEIVSGEVVAAAVERARGGFLAKNGGPQAVAGD
jgi:cell division protease FtsH